MSITNINNIPPEVIREHIFPNFQSKDLPAAALVCKLWNEYAKDDNIWKPLIQKDFPKYEIALTPSVKEQYKAQKIAEIEKNYPSEFLRAFGGAEEFLKLPILKAWNIRMTGEYVEFIEQKHLTAPIMRGKDDKKRYFIVFKIKEKTTGCPGYILINQWVANSSSDWSSSKHHPEFDYYLPHDALIDTYADEILYLVKGIHSQLILAK